MARLAMAANSTWNIQNFRGGLVRDLIAHGHEVVTISPEPHGIASTDMKVPHLQCEMVRSGANPFQDFGYFCRLLAALRKARAEVLLSFTIKPNVYGCLASRVLGIAAVPNVSGLGTAFLSTAGLRAVVLNLYRLAFAKADRVFFQNPDDERLFLDLGVVNSAQTAVIPGSGVDLTHFATTPLPSKPRFLMIARLLGDKGVREYAEAAKIVRISHPDTEFSLLGEFDFYNRSAVKEGELNRWVAEGSINYLGYTSDVRPFIEQASAIVLPSYREGLPRTLLEGAAMGRPLIGTDVAGCREVIKDGVTGYLCRARSINSLAEALARFASIPSDERAAMGCRARWMVEQQYDERIVFRAYLEAIASAC